MLKNTESADFSAIIIFYLMILQLLNNDNDASNSPITLFELIEYFKRNKKIVIDVNVYKKLLALFNKHKELLSTIQIKNKSQIILDISKLVKTYNKTKINKNFVTGFYKKLKKIIDKIILTRSEENNKNFNIKNIRKIMTGLLIVGTIGLKIRKNSAKFTTKILKFKVEFLKKFLDENKINVDKYKYLLNTQHVLNRHVNKISIHKNVYYADTGGDFDKQTCLTAENYGDSLHAAVQDRNIEKIIIEANNIEKIENIDNDERNATKVIKIHKRKNTKYDSKRRDNIDEPKTNNLMVKNFENNAILNKNINSSIDALDEEMRKRYIHLYLHELNTKQKAKTPLSIN